jgi:hypothetical protein
MCLYVLLRGKLEHARVTMQNEHLLRLLQDNVRLSRSWRVVNYVAFLIESFSHLVDSGLVRRSQHMRLFVPLSRAAGHRAVAGIAARALMELCVQQAPPQACTHRTRPSV